MGLKDDNQKLRQERDGLRSTIQGLRVTNLGLATELGTLKKIIADAMAAERDALDKGHRISVILAQRDAALARAEADQRTREQLAQMTQAVGLLTTLHGSMEIDVEHPVEMAQQIHAHVQTELAALRAQREGRCGTCRDWHKGADCPYAACVSAVSRCADSRNDDGSVQWWPADHGCPAWRQREEGR